MTTNQSTPNKSFMSNFFKDCLVFLSLVTLIYVCYITSGVYHEKMYFQIQILDSNIIIWIQQQDKNPYFKKQSSSPSSHNFAQPSLDTFINLYSTAKKMILNHKTFNKNVVFHGQKQLFAVWWSISTCTLITRQ